MSAKSSTRRREIVLAALACFTEHGVEATSIDMIREASGASVGSLYHHFGNKEGLAAEVYLEGLRDFRQFLAEALRPVTGLEAATRAIVHANVDWICANPDWARFIFGYRMVLAKANRETDLQAEAQGAQSAIVAQLERLLAPGQNMPWPPEVYHSLVIGPTHDYARNWLEGRRQRPLVELREVFADAAWNSLGFSASAKKG